MAVESSNFKNRELWFRRWAMLTALFAAPVSIVLTQHMLNDPDLWFHLRTGAWIAAHSCLPWTDPFSAYGNGKPWIAYTWLFDLIVYGAYRAWNLVGIVVLQVALAVAIGVALFQLISRLQASFVKSVFLTAAGLVAMLPLFSPRPWLFTILFFILELDIVLAVRESGQCRRLLLLLPLFCVWANLHIQFLYGLFVLALASLEAAAGRAFPKMNGFVPSPRCPPRYWIGITAGCGLVTLINPYHIVLYRVIYIYLHERATYKYIAELQALSFRDYQAYLVLLIALAAALAIGWSHRINLFSFVLLITATLVSFRTQRDCWFIVIIGLATIASLWSSTPARYKISISQWISSLVAAAAVLLGVAHARHVSNSSLQMAIAHAYPADAVKTIRKRGYSGPLFNYFDWGGYLIWDLPELPVSIDGRNDFYGDQRITRAFNTWYGARDWDSDADLMSAHIVLGPRNLPLCSLLERDPRFQKVYEDNVAAVFIRR
jgi:hypothetical protein